MRSLGFALAMTFALSSGMHPAHATQTQAAPAAAVKSFADRLVTAARDQGKSFALYTPAYVKIPYPGGDVPASTGVCTDVIVRAYRALGIDLQVEIHKSGVGTGDTNIDHRRVEVQRKFFARKGKSLPVSMNPKDYKPGDIVTFHLAHGWFSNTHVAIVSDKLTSDGIPLVIHNRGLGVQEENWLFAEKITGHFQYRPNPE
ncbi:MAG: DUF1287 domain-containing protein [Hyphomicrobiaceae bacterium]